MNKRHPRQAVLRETSCRQGLEQKAEIFKWLESVCFRSFYNGVDDSTGIGAFGRIGKQPSSSAPRQVAGQKAPPGCWTAPGAHPEKRLSASFPATRHKSAPRQACSLARDFSRILFSPRRRRTPPPAWLAPTGPGTSGRKKDPVFSSPPQARIIGCRTPIPPAPEICPALLLAGS